MRFVVYGAGAIGGVIGAHLFRGGHDVTLIARGAHHDAIREHGLRLDTPDESVTLPIPVAARPAEVEFGDGDIVILAMKTQDTAPALAELSAVAPPGIVVVSAQNGVENERLALRLFPEVYGVCVVLPATFLEPGVVEASMAPVGGLLDVGRYPRGDDDTARALAAAFRESRFEAEARPDIMRYKYGKLLNNLSNAAQVIIGLGEQSREVVRLAREEGVECLRAAGIEAEHVEPVLAQTRPVQGRERGGGSSFQSLQRGTGTIETDYLNGEIVLLGRRYGVPTPVNELLRSVANRMAREGLPPGLMTAEEFLGRLDGRARR
ncbi:2-dehydropantoate 2-reductase [Actinomadura sp. DC4]|uniref:ketopantoate reductase family protein n=1 Tax=Actinomadura sp. DC4 TaxID=3055069 RepID=UPI0025AF81C9|nr:2-dehydropantoate 2-reductase [Actinomadura sp. DC4]MDN3353301.1 2-dehydropantoate 2-reductase [Actinomadura sp. DC4]